MVNLFQCIQFQHKKYESHLWQVPDIGKSVNNKHAHTELIWDNIPIQGPYMAHMVPSNVYGHAGAIFVPVAFF